MTSSDRNERYDDLLNEIYGPVRLGQFEFSPADIFFELDPTAYRVGLADWEEYGDEDEDEELEELCDYCVTSCMCNDETWDDDLLRRAERGE